MEESSRDSYQKLGDPGEEENNNTEKKCNKKLIIIIFVVLGLVAAGVVVAIILLSSSSPSPSPEKKCPDGQYLPSDDKSECYNCTSNCKQCTGTKTESQCTACYDGYSLDGDICVGLFSFKGEYTTQADLEKVYFFNDAFTGNIENMTIDGIETNPASYHEFDKPGNHKVYFNLKNDSMVTDLSFLFSSISQLNSMVFSEDFDSTNVTNISSMFYDCQNLTSVDLGHFITTNVVNMTDLFSFCNELNYVDISKFSTNMNKVTLFDSSLPPNGSITLTREFYDKISGQFPESWTVHYSDSDIYDLLEN